jgi:transposase
VKLPNEVVKTAASTGAEESRRPTVVPAPTAVDPELSTRPRRRRFTTQEKLRILAEIDQASQSGGIGSILRQEDLYWSTLSRLARAARRRHGQRPIAGSGGRHDVT